MKFYSCVVVLFCLMGLQMADSCGDGTNVSFGFSQLTVYNVSIDAQSILKGPLYQLGNFEQCLNTEGKHYCLARIHLHPSGKPSPFWSNIQALIAVKTHVPRDELFLGLCVPNSCNTSSTRKAIFNELKPAANALGVRVNIQMESSYCQKANDVHLTTGDYIMGIVSVVILTLLVIGTLYEISIFLQKQGKMGTGLVVQFIMCFSLISNWKRLWAISSTSNSKNFRAIQGIRFITMYLIITGHTNYGMFITAHDNPEWIEQSYKDFTRTLIFNGFFVTCTFFAISGYLLGYMGMVEMEKNGFTLLQYLKGIGHRYLRLTPAVAVVVGIAATWLKFLGFGPVWPLWGQIEIDNCKHHWWINLIYLQNYFYAERPCLLHMWYLAADFQNFMVFMLLLGLVYKYQKWTKTIFMSTLAVFIFISITQTYVEHLDPTVLTYPKVFRNITYNKTFLRNYVTFHHNAAPYLIGVIAGYAYYITSTKNTKISKTFTALIWIIATIVPWGTMLLGYIFYQPNYEYNIYIASAYAGFSKTLFATGISLILFGCSTGVAWIVNTILSWRPFQVLGRLTFATYVVHLLVLEAEYSSVRRNLHISLSFMMRETIADVVISLACGLALCLCVEMPTSALLKLSSTRRSADNEVPAPKVNNEVNGSTVIERNGEICKIYNERL